jgi:hypothetical protein
MATAAPSGGEAAQPQPTPEGQEGQAGGAAGSTADPIQTTEATGQDGLELEYTESKLKPKKALPGVMDEGPIEATKREPDAPTEGRPRDEKGRFVAAAPPDGTPAPEPGETPATPEPPVDPEASKGVFKFAGKEYASQAEAEQRHKSLEGQFKPLIEDRNTAAYSANAWKHAHDNVAAENQQLRAELEALKAAPQSQPAAESPKDAPSEIDWALYAEIRKEAERRGEPWQADQWLQKQQAAIWEAKEAALREELTAPVRAAEARKQLYQQTDQLFSALAEYTNEDGSPAYPELRDPEQAYTVGRFWTALGQNLPKNLQDAWKHIATTQMGALASIGLFRLANGSPAAAAPEPAPAPSDPQAPTPPAAPQAPDAAALAAASLDGGQPSPMPSPSSTPGDPRAAALVAGLKKTELTRKGLGFSA